MAGETPILVPVTNQWQLQLQRGKWTGRSWRVRLQVCQHPLCHCSDVVFEAELVGSGEPTAALQFVLDPLERKIAENAELDATETELAQAVVAEFTDDGWLRLAQCLYAEKRATYERMDVTRLNAVFRPEVMDGDGTMVGYAELFRFADGFPFTHNGDKWLTDDQYCVTPECGCRDAVLTFLHIRPTTGGQSVVDEPPAVVRYNYQTSNFEIVDDSPRELPPPAALVAAVRAAHPDLDRTLNLRHSQIKTLYTRARRKHRRKTVTPVATVAEPRATPKTTKIGRNQFCPCGSGKKYKRCCGRQ